MQTKHDKTTQLKNRTQGSMNVLPLKEQVQISYRDSGNLVKKQMEKIPKNKTGIS